MHNFEFGDNELQAEFVFVSHRVIIHSCSDPYLRSLCLLEDSLSGILMIRVGFAKKALHDFANSISVL